MNEHLRRAMVALDIAASELRQATNVSTGDVRQKLRQTVEEILDHLEQDDRARGGEPEDVITRLDRQAKDIADDLRRAERLMRQRTNRE